MEGEGAKRERRANALAFFSPFFSLPLSSKFRASEIFLLSFLLLTCFFKIEPFSSREGETPLCLSPSTPRATGTLAFSRTAFPSLGTSALASPRIGERPESAAREEVVGGGPKNFSKIFGCLHQPLATKPFFFSLSLSLSPLPSSLDSLDYIHQTPIYDRR